MIWLYALAGITMAIWSGFEMTKARMRRGDISLADALGVFLVAIIMGVLWPIPSLVFGLAAMDDIYVWRKK